MIGNPGVQKALRINIDDLPTWIPGQASDDKYALSASPTVTIVC